MLRRGQCVSIVGPRRIGKTSFLFHLCDPQVQREHELREEYLFVYIDCQGLGDLDKPRFYQWMWDGAKRALAERGEADQWAERTSSFEEFREVLMAVQEREYKLVFLFDEFEYLATSSYMDRAAFSSLRNLSQELQVAYVTASQMPVGQLIYYDRSALYSPFFSNFQTIHLGFLKPDEAERMVFDLTKIAGQVDLFSERDLDFAFGIAGYHPFFLQFACYYLFERKIGCRELVTGDYELVRRQYAEDVERFFRYTWDHLEEDEQESVRLVSQGHTLDGEQARWLEEKGVLHNNVVFSSVFAQFVRNQADVESTREPSEPKMCQLSIVCNRHGWTRIRITGLLAYEADGARVLDASLVDRLHRRAAVALRSEDWRFRIREIGRELFEELVLNQPEIAKGYQRAMSHVQQAMLSLALHAPEYFLRLPFEALHSEDEGYLCLKFPIYRVVRRCFFDKRVLSAALLNRLDLQGKRLRALVVASSTWGTPGAPIPGVEEEAREVSVILQHHGFDVCLLSTDNATEKRIRHELARGDYLLFHYAGHASSSPDVPEEGALYFWEGTKGKSQVRKLTASQLVGLVQNTPLRFVYLSSCWGGAQTTPPNLLLDDDFLGVMDGLVMAGVPAVLGFRWPVSDCGAQLLAQSFYAAWLERGYRPDRALCEARRTVADQMGRDERAWFSPILAMRAPNF
jgi:CHAT domain-containing protein